MGKVGFDLPGPREKNEFLKQEPPHSLIFLKMLKDVPPSCSFKTKCVADFGVTVQILRSSVPS